MSKRLAVAIWMALGAALSMTACVANVDDPEPEMEDIDVVESSFGAIRPHPRIRYPQPLPPDWRRTLRCLYDPHKQYIVRDPEACAAIRFYCPVGTPFFDDCGCGCEVEVEVEASSN